MLGFARIAINLHEALGRLRWNKDQLRQYQNKRLRKIVGYAYEKVPFYQAVMKQANVTPSDIKTISDLSKLPIIRKADMRKCSETDLISSEFNIYHLKPLTTGGSTGEPFSIYVNNSEDAWRKAIYMRANVSCGQKMRDRWVAILNEDRSVDTAALQHRFRLYAQTVVPVHWSRQAQLGAVRKLNPDVLDGFSSALWLLAREAELQNVDSIRPRMMFGSAELISQSSVGYLERIFKAPYYDQFGCTEIDRSAWQCPEKSGYHMDVDSALMQFVSEEGDEVSSGERGEIVYTSLFNYAMPFIRYSTGDIGVPVDDVCSCGRTLPLMKIVEGRDNSFIILPDGHVIAPMSFIESLKAFEYVHEIDKYRVIQSRENMIEIYIKKSHDSVDEEKLMNRLMTNIKEGLTKLEKANLSDVEIKFKFVDDLPSTRRGKLNVIVSYVQPPRGRLETSEMYNK